MDDPSSRDTRISRLSPKPPHLGGRVRCTDILPMMRRLSLRIRPDTTAATPARWTTSRDGRPTNTGRICYVFNGDELPRPSRLPARASIAQGDGEDVQEFMAEASMGYKMEAAAGINELGGPHV
jgi:hypothetical protein